MTIHTDDKIQFADSVWIAHNIHTFSDGDGTHIAVRRGVVVAVGGTEVDRFRGPHTTIHTFDGTITPGLSDGHMHPTAGLGMVRGVNLTDVYPLDEVGRLLAEEAARDGSWDGGLIRTTSPRSDLMGACLTRRPPGNPCTCGCVTLIRPS